MYDINYDIETGIFNIVARGNWTLSTLASFSAAVLARGTATRIRYGQFAVLTDLRGLGVLPQDVARGITVLLDQSTKLTTAPFAVVVPTMLHKLQISRIMNAPHVCVFLVWDDAIQWLDDKWGRRPARAG